MTQPAPKKRAKPTTSLRWVRWTTRYITGGEGPSSAHAFKVTGGRMATRSLCGRRWKERGIQVVKDPSVGRCRHCDAELRDGPIDQFDEVLAQREASKQLPPTEYRPRFTRRDYE